jgi:tRNA-splicing ligase RtcB (3'-phosphate/5'-hydroxy nucleic acid ligase)
MSLPNEKMIQKNYNVIGGLGGAPIKLWNKHVKIEDKAIEQLHQVAAMPFVKPWVAAMPDTHWGMGATVGSVIPTVGAVMPAAVGVDIGCGMMAVRTNLNLSDWVSGNINYSNLAFDAISAAVPHGRTNDGGTGDRGAWGVVPDDIHEIWEREFLPSIGDSLGYAGPFVNHPGALSKNAEKQLGTLGTGNHFIEVCTEIDNPDSNLWVVIHSGSRGFGNRIGSYFTKLAGDLCKKWGVQLPNKDLGYLPIDTPEYDDYLTAVKLAQKFAWTNRMIMMHRALTAIGAQSDGYPDVVNDQNGVPSLIHVHHNYMTQIRFGNLDLNLTRKGAVDASEGNWVIIPGSMGAKTYIGRGLGNRDSFFSCSHGAGRAMSRTQALKTFTVEDHAKATDGVYCDKTVGVLDETPACYKNIDDVMESQRDLVEPILKIKQLLCVKGLSD